jgi:hypothetical protein
MGHLNLHRDNIVALQLNFFLARHCEAALFAAEAISWSADQIASPVCLPDGRQVGILPAQCCTVDYNQNRKR